jgi:hypothetical protein
MTDGNRPTNESNTPEAAAYSQEAASSQNNQLPSSERRTSQPVGITNGFTSNAYASNAYKDIFEFSARQMSESRSAFENYYKLTIGGLLLIASVTIGAFYWLVGDKYKDIAKDVQDRADVQLVELTKEIRDRVESQFETQRMHGMIEQVATEQTKKGLGTVIERAVTATVEQRVKAEEPQIHAAVQAETARAISSLNPKIEASVKERATSAEQRIDTELSKRAADAEQRIDAQLTKREELVKAGNMAVLARNGIASAYDQLIALASKTADQDVQLLAISTRNQVYLEMDTAATGFYLTRNFREARNNEQLRALLTDVQPLSRKAAVDSLVAAGDKSAVPLLIETLKHDPFMMVREAAYRGLTVLTGQKIEPLNDAQWDNWWQQNKGTWPSK